MPTTEAYVSDSTVMYPDQMALQAHELVLALSGPHGFELPEPVSETGEGEILRDENFQAIGGGAECNVYLHGPTMMVYKVPHTNNWKYWGTRETIPRAMVEAALHQAIRYARVDAVRLAGLGAEYVPTWFISSNDEHGRDVFVIAQPYLDPEAYTPHILTPTLRAEFELAHVDDLSAANVLLSVHSNRLVLMDCLFATEID